MGHLTFGLIATMVPAVALLFGLIAMGVIYLRKPPPTETPSKPANMRPPPKPKRIPTEPNERAQKRAERRAKRKRGL
jgi:hypothetical protein